MEKLKFAPTPGSMLQLNKEVLLLSNTWEHLLMLTAKARGFARSPR
jgi:hypothetical protein